MAGSGRDDAEDSEDAGSSYRSRRPKTSRSFRAGLIFPVGRIDRFLRKGAYAERIGAGASVYMAAVLQYLMYDIVDTAGKKAASDNRRRIAPKHLQWTIDNDDELHSLLGNIEIPQVKTIRRARKTRKTRKNQSAASARRGRGKNSRKSYKSVKGQKAVAA